MRNPDSPDAHGLPVEEQLPLFIDQHRAMLRESLEGLTEEEARRSLVPSRTTLLGLVKHATFVERVWFDEAISCRTRRELGIPEGPDESFVLAPDDTIASVLAAHREAVERSRRAVADLGVGDLVLGNRRGPLPLGWVHLHVLRELAQHCGHADILREQVLAARDRPAAPTPDDPRGTEVVLTGVLECANDEQAEVVRRHLPEHVRLTTAESGCLEFDVVPSEQPGVWNVRERFVDAASFRAHQARVAGSAWGRATDGIERRYEVRGLDAEGVVEWGRPGGRPVAPLQSPHFATGGGMLSP